MKKKKSVSNTREMLLLRESVIYFATRLPLFYCFIRPQEALLFKLFEKYVEAPILDFGCGDGIFAKHSFIKQKVAHQIQVGLDITTSKIDQAPVTNVYKKLVKYNGLDIPLADSSFQTVVSNCVFEHLDDLNVSLSEISRVIKPGGYLLTTVMTDKWEKNLLGKKLFGEIYANWLRKKQVHRNLLSAEQWKKRFQDAGFEVIEARGYLPMKLARLLEIFHYLSIPLLIAPKFLLEKLFYINSIFSKPIASMTESSQWCDTKQSSAIFYVLRKKMAL